MTADSKVNILVVDDLPEKRLVMESILAELDENVILARSGEEALLQVLRHDFAVILLDVNMPSLDGYETAALIRKRRRSAHTPIIFITGYADE
ncbi:MAG TPA: response regulator, partial [Pseudomonadota bacterium]|nr:response regulator [Pseudomonadota bacterium]